MPTLPPPASILIVDDEPGVRALLCEVLKREGYYSAAAESGEAALEILKERHFDVVVTDMRMPGISGLDLMRSIRGVYYCDVVVLTAFSTDYQYEAVVEEGAADFLLKPCRPTEFVTRLKRVLAQRALRLERDGAMQELQKALHEVREAYLDTIHRLSVATEYKDVDTGDHIIRLGRLSAFLAARVGVSVEDTENILYGAPMHDVGKIGIPDSILLKPGRLSPAEFEVMKTHTTIGASILEKPKSTILECARVIALTHHEQWDGNGYPQRLSGNDIPLSGRIVKLVDVFDALVSARPYKEPYPVDVALTIIEKGRGTHFDPKLVDLMKSNIGEIMRLRKLSGEPEETVSQFAWSERDDVFQRGL